jgi:hypothetical protein
MINTILRIQYELFNTINIVNNNELRYDKYDKYNMKNTIRRV